MANLVCDVQCLMIFVEELLQGVGKKLWSRPFLNYIYLLAMFIIPNHVLFFVCVCHFSSVLFNQRAFRTVKSRNADVLMLNTVCGAIQDINYANTITISIFTI